MSAEDYPIPKILKVVREMNMATNQHENGVRVDIDTLIGRIRQHARKQSAEVSSSELSKPTNGVAGVFMRQAAWNEKLVQHLDSVSEALEAQQGDLARLQADDFFLRTPLVIALGMQKTGAA